MDNQEEYNKTLEKFYQLHQLRKQSEEQEMGEIMEQHNAPVDVITAELPTYWEGDAYYDAIDQEETLQSL